MTNRLVVNPGDRFGMLTVICEEPILTLPSGQPNRVFKCRCDCGVEKSIRLVHLTNGRIVSCSCRQGEKHGESKTGLYRVWQVMIQRCEADYSTCSNRYKGRGITVCPEWRDSFITFREWANAHGYKKGLEIDRINNDDNYHPDNCRLVPRFINVANRRISFKVEYYGIIISLSLLMRILGIDTKKFSLIHRRLLRGWEFQKAVSVASSRSNRYVETQDKEARESDLKTSKFNDRKTNKVEC